jgi:uncharacterized protein YdhG (YjbR/CyaY superfamily)
MSGLPSPRDIDEYIAAFPPEVQAILKEIRSTVRKSAPQAQEKISYRMPAFFLDGAVVYFAAFKMHIGLYPPVTGDPKLLKSLARYRGPKGNLKFPLDEPIPYALIGRIVQARVKERQERAAVKRRK